MIYSLLSIIVALWVIGAIFTRDVWVVFGAKPSWFTYGLAALWPFNHGWVQLQPVLQVINSSLAYVLKSARSLLIYVINKLKNSLVYTVSAFAFMAFLVAIMFFIGAAYVATKLNDLFNWLADKLEAGFETFGAIAEAIVEDDLKD